MSLETDPAALALRAARPTTLCVIGAGYVGLTAAVCLAQLGHRVGCVETDPGRLRAIRAGHVPIEEPGVAELLAAHLASGRLRVTDDVAEGVSGASVAMLCVGTPPTARGDPDLRQIAHAARAAARAATDHLVLVVKSTVPPGSCEALELLVAPERGDVRVTVASNPEFLREGRAVFDFFHPDRVVVGVDPPGSAELVVSLYPAAWPRVVCDRRSAELVKYAANTFLAVKISFANEVAGLCEALGADADQVLHGVGLDARIGAAFLGPGPGFGGSCLPKDVSGFVAVAEAVQHPARMARAAEAVNEDAIVGLVAKIESAVGPLRGVRVGLLGLAFKAGTDDVRHSPGLGLATALAAAGARITAHDPLAVVPQMPGLQFDDPYEAARGAEAVVVTTAWPAYRELDLRRLRREMAGSVVVDAVGVLDGAALSAAGLEWYGVGRGRPLGFHPVVTGPLEWALEGEPASGTAISGSPAGR